MKSKIQDLIRQGNDKELQKILTNQPLEISKSDIDKLIGIAEYTGQSSIVNILQESAKSLTKDEWTQCSSLNTTGDTDKEDNESIKTTLLEDFLKIKLIIEDKENIQSYLSNKEWKHKYFVS